MKRTLKNFLLSTLILVITISSIGMVNVTAAEDTTAPELVSIKVKPSSIKAGDNIEVYVKVKETGTGVVNAAVQFNNSEAKDIMVHESFDFDKPLYSTKNKYIEKKFIIPTRENSESGTWYIGNVEFTDQKGNCSRYFAYAKNNKIILDIDGGIHVFDADTHVKVSGSKGDFKGPVINSIKVINPTVEKGEVLKIEADITEPSGIDTVQIDLSCKTEDFVYQNGSVKGPNGNNKYIFEIPISSKRHLGEWKIDELRFMDKKGNDSHYANIAEDGYITDYNETIPGKFAPLKFTVTGVAGDETAPVVNSIKILNDDFAVSKPGIVKVELDIVEEGEGVSFIDITYEIPKNLEDEADGSAVANSRGNCYFMLSKTENKYSNTTIVRFDKPLKTGKHIFEVPLPSIRPNGNYIAYVYAIEDCAENRNEYHAYRKPRAEFKVEDEYEYAFEMGIQNDALRDAVKSLKNGEVGRILLSDDPEQNVLPKQVLGDIAKKDKTLICYRDGYQWIFRGLDIEPSKTKDLNLTTRIFTIDGDNLSSGKKAAGISFENNGKLPGKVEFRFKTSFVKNYFGKEENLKLYHVENSEGGYETDIDYEKTDYEQIPSKDANIKVVLEEKDAWCYIDLTHNSKYVLSDSKITKLSKKPTASKPTTSKPTVSSGVDSDTQSSSNDSTESQNDKDTLSEIASSETNENISSNIEGGSQVSKPKPKKNYELAILIIVIGILLVGVAGFILIKKKKQ